jgi:hypothetical protein
MLAQTSPPAKLNPFKMNKNSHIGSKHTSLSPNTLHIYITDKIQAMTMREARIL